MQSNLLHNNTAHLHSFSTSSQLLATTSIYPNEPTADQQRFPKSQACVAQIKYNSLILDAV